MCLLVALSRIRPSLPLVVAGNRDERYDRPAEPMVVLRDAGPRVIGGRDAKAGGTWLAVNEHGVVAGLTNRPSPDGADPTKRSRGELPLLLASHRSAREAVEAFAAECDPTLYNSAWLLVGDRQALFEVDVTGPPAPTVTELPPGLHVLENRAIGEPSAKVEHVRAGLDGLDGIDDSQLLLRLQAALADHRIPPRLPEDRGTDADDEWAAYRAPCVHTPEFGTRWSGLVTVPVAADARPTVTYSDGAPCEGSFVDASPLWP